MTRLDELQKPLTELSTDELLQLIRDIRRDRSISKAANRRAPSQRRKAADKLKALIESLPADQRAELLKTLG